MSDPRKSQLNNGDNKQGQNSGERINAPRHEPSHQGKSNDKPEKQQFKEQQGNKTGGRPEDGYRKK